MEKQRVLFLSDGHSGHIKGLTPPGWQTTEEHEEWWDRFVGLIEPIKPVQKLVLMGDMIDGEGIKYNRGTESLTTSLSEQLEMVQVGAVELVEPESIVVVGGTDSHSGDGQNFEEHLAKNLRNTGKYNDVTYMDNGDIVIREGKYILNLKHYTPSSVVPYGPHTGPAREAVTDLLDKLAEFRESFEERYGVDPKDVVKFFHIRGHVHYWSLAETSYYTALTCPCLLPSSRHGRKKYNRAPNWGIVYFDFYNDKYVHYKEIIKLNFKGEIVKW